MPGFGAKIVLAKTWGFKGANIESFGNSGCPLYPAKTPNGAPRALLPKPTKSSSMGALKHPRGHFYIRNGVIS